jgi:putative ABC transport system permease protein
VRTPDAFGFAVEALARQPLRTALTVLAVAVGAAAVLLLTALGGAAHRYVVAQFASLGTNGVAVMPGRTETTGVTGAVTGTTHDLTLDDAAALRRELPEALYVTPMTLGTAPFEFETRRRDVYVVGTTPDYFDVLSLRVTSGRILPGGDMRRGERVTVIGSRLAHEVFGATNPLGRTVRIADTRFRVLGVLAPKGTTLGIDFDDHALVPVSSGLRLFHASGLDRITIQAPDAASIPLVVRRSRAVLTERHRDEDFTVITQDAMLASFDSILHTLTLALAGIAAISLAVAGIGIMNVMLVSVTERVREVGLLKALGAGSGEITTLFLIEAACLSGIGAIAGTAASLAILRIVAWTWPILPLHPSLVWIVVVFALSLVAGMAFGILPARRAAALSAVDALRGRMSD